MKAQGAIGDVAGGSDEFPYFYQLFKEYMDNFIQSVAAIDWAEVFSEIGQGFIDLMVAIPEKLQELSAAEVGYYSGYIAFNIAEFFFPVLKIAKLAKAGKLAEGFAEMVTDMQKVAQNMANAGRKVGRAVSQAPKKAYDFALDMLDNLTALLRQGTATVKELVQKMFERIRAWLDDALNTLENELLFFNRKTAQVYGWILPIKSVIKIFTLPIARILRKGGLKVAKVKDGYILYYNGTRLLEGSKSEITDFLASYKKLSKKDFRKVLDDLRTVRRRQLAHTKWIDKFDLMFANHLDGEIGLERIAYGLGTFVDEFLSIGQGGHRLNKGIRLKNGTVRIPEPPIRDMPYKANIEVKYKNEWLTKPRISSMFPENWSFQRIQEEVALAYEKTVQKGIGLNPNTINKPIKQYLTKDSSNTFDILIELNNNGQIINSYAKIL